ncbi:hypothetical protein QP747_10440, partial [Actinomyces urogenitalis]|nr:hypothetical protein [Actinomyces urogenitalis]
ARHHADHRWPSHRHSLAGNHHQGNGQGLGRRGVGPLGRWGAGALALCSPQPRSPANLTP